jgi:hypothetical protein
MDAIDVLRTRMALLLHSDKSKQAAKRGTIPRRALTPFDLSQIAGLRFVCSMAIEDHLE